MHPHLFPLPLLSIDLLIPSHPFSSLLIPSHPPDPPLSLRVPTPPFVCSFASPSAKSAPSCHGTTSQTPNLLTFFIASTFWSAASYALLSLGGEGYLAVGSAIVFPATLFAFIRPFPLPYSWAAPPEPLSRHDAGFACALFVALAVFHTSNHLVGAERRQQLRAARVHNGAGGGGGAKVHMSARPSWDARNHGGERESCNPGDSPSAEGLVGPSIYNM